MNAQPVHPSRLWYWVAGTAVLGAVAWLALGFLFWFRSIIRAVDEFQRVPIPGQAELSFDRPGSYTVYLEGLGAGDETATIPAFDISIAPVGGGEKVPIRPYEGSELDNMAGHSGRAVGTFQIDEPGRFLVEAAGEPQSVQADVAIGSSIGGDIARSLLPTVPGVLVLFFGGVVLAVVVANRRSHAHRPQPAPAAQAGTWAQGAAPAGWFADPMAGTSSATGMGSGGLSMSPTAQPKQLTPCERAAGLVPPSVPRRPEAITPRGNQGRDETAAVGGAGRRSASGAAAPHDQSRAKRTTVGARKDQCVVPWRRS